MQLDEIVNWINAAFGEVTPRPAYSDVEALKKIFGNSGYQRYLQDQGNRQIIRDYLTNAVVLGETIWRTQFGARPDMLGQTLMINSVPRVVIGIMPAPPGSSPVMPGEWGRIAYGARCLRNLDERGGSHRVSRHARVDRPPGRG